MTNICIAVRKGDEETLKKMEEGLKKIGLTSKEDMDKLMDESFKDVPASTIGALSLQFFISSYERNICDVCGDGQGDGAGAL